MAQLMDALVKPVAGPGLELRQVPVPEPGPGEVLIKIHKTAICGTDVHIYNWDPWAREHIKPPMVIGHEYVGEVAKLGVNALNGLTDTLRSLNVTEVVEAMDMDQNTKPEVRKAILAMRKEVQKFKRWKYTKYTWDPAYKGVDDYLLSRAAAM